MKTHQGALGFTSDKGTVVTIGTFDGVHLGHQKIIKRLTESATKNGLASVVLTFFPHPRMVVQNDTSIKLINTIDERAALLERHGLEHLVIHPFTREFARYDAEGFVEDILVNALRAKRVIIGYDHRFGRNRAADIKDLKRYGKAFGFEVEEISKQELDDVAISSTKVRKALKEGDVALANSYLGIPFTLYGTVIHGRKLGRTIGYPTANLRIKEAYKLIPAHGVYVVKTTINDQAVYGMMNIGTNPTVGGQEQSVETYFFDFNQDLYGAHLSVSLLAHIRKEEKFASIEALQEVMKKDEAFSRQWIQENMPAY